jgi:hypothetical protein
MTRATDLTEARETALLMVVDTSCEFGTFRINDHQQLQRESKLDPVATFVFVVIP